MKKKLILALGAIALMGGSLTVAYSAQSPMPVNAEGETSEVEASVGETSTSEAVSEEASEGNSIIAEASNWVENKVIPLIGSVSIATIVSTIVSIVTAFTKYKGDKANKTLIVSQDDKIAALSAEVEKLKAENAAYRAYTEKMMEDFKITLIDTSATMTQVSNYAKTTAELVATQNGQIAKVEKMKNVIGASCDLMAKSFALSEVAVKSGIAKDAQRLVANLKEVNNNGEGE